MPPKKRRKQREVPDEGPETFTQADEVFSDEEDGDEEEEEEDFQASAQDKSDEEEEDEAAGTGPAGTIGRMVVKNFMNHEHLKMDLKPGINFIIGKNGSGKSAMCHAAQVALGASAKDTERGSSMAGFVRHGQPSCEVRLEIRNAPRDDAYEYGKYGDVIVVERTVNASGGGSYRLRDSNDKVVSRTRDDLQRVLDHYNIQVNNPCSVLGQDDSKKLATGTDDYKYQFYLRASGLQTVLDQLKAAKNAMTQINEILERQGKEVPRLEGELAVFQKEHDDAEELYALQDKLKRTVHELAWSLVRDQRLEIAEHMQRIDEQKVDVDKHEQAIQKFTSELEGLRPQYDDGAKQLAEFNQKLSTNQQQTQELKRAEDRAKKEAKKKRKEIQGKRAKADDLKKDIATNQEEVSKIKEAPLENAGARKMQKARESMDAVNAEAQETKKDFSRLNKEIEEVEQDVVRLREDEHQHKESLKHLSRDTQDCGKNMVWLQKNTGNEDARFGEDLMKLFNLIDKNASKFSIKPIGPVGKYITMKDNRYSEAVESAIGQGPLTTLLVASYQDEQLVMNLAKNARINLRAVKIFRTKIDGASYRDTGQLRMDRFPARNKGYTQVLDVIEITNTAVENYLYDKQVYQSLLCRDHAECVQIAYVARPQNVKNCYDMEGHRYFLTGNSQQRIPFLGGHNFLVADNTQAIADGERKLQQAKDKVIAEKQRFALSVQKYQRDGQTPQVRIKFLEKARSLNEKKQGMQGVKINMTQKVMNEMAEEADEETVRDGEINDLNATSQLNQEEIDNIGSQLESSEQEYEQLRQEADEAERKKDEFVKQQDSNVDQMMQNTQDEMEKLAIQIDKKENKVKGHTRKQKEARVALTHCEKQHKEAEKDEVKKTKQAQTFCEKDEEYNGEGATTAVLNKQRQQCLIRLEKEAQKRDGRTLEAIDTDLERAQRALEGATKAMVHVMKTQKRVAKGFTARKKKYFDFRKTTARSARKMFNKHLGKKGHHGDLMFSHKNKTLGIKVMLMSDGAAREVTNTKTLSGGEKSFTTLALLLALGSVTQVPFAIFDEIDVFMDDVNRKITLQALYDEAKLQAGKRQYCVLTPHDLTGIKTDDDTQILKMKEPTRLGQ